MNSVVKVENYQNEVSDGVVSNKRLFSFLFQGFCYGAVVGCMSMLIPLYALNLKADAVQVGLITGSRGMGHFLLVIPVGLLIDRFGIRKVLTISSCFSFLIVLLMPLAKKPEILLAFALVEGLACSARLTAFTAWNFELLPFLKPSQTGWYKGVCGTGTTIIGPILSVFLFGKLGFTVTFTIIAIITIVANLIEIFFGTSSGAKKKENGQVESIVSACISQFKMFKNPKFLFVSYGECLYSAFTTCFRLLIILLIVDSMHKTANLVSLQTSCVGISYLIIVFFGGFLLKYLKAASMYVLSSSIIAIALFILAINEEIIFISLASVLAGIGLGILSLVNYRTIASLKGDSGKVSGIITFSTGVTMCMAPMIISCIVEMYNFKIGFFALIIPFLVVIILLLLKEKYFIQKRELSNNQVNF